MFKKGYSLYSAFYTQLAFYSQSAVCILPPVRSLQSAFYTDRFMFPPLPHPPPPTNLNRWGFLWGWPERCSDWFSNSNRRQVYLKGAFIQNINQINQGEKNKAMNPSFWSVVNSQSIMINMQCIPAALTNPLISCTVLFSHFILFV